MRWADIGERRPDDSQADPGHLLTLPVLPYCMRPYSGCLQPDLTLAPPSGPRDALPRAYLPAPPAMPG